MLRLRVTDTKTGKVWEEDNHPHSWESLALHLMNTEKEFNIMYCDIECLAKGASLFIDSGHKECWYMLDKIGRYEPLPEHYKVEEI